MSGQPRFVSILPIDVASFLGRLALLAPRQWPGWLGAALLVAVCWMPAALRTRWTAAACRRWRIAERSRAFRRMLANIEACFPARTATQHLALARQARTTGLNSVLLTAEMMVRGTRRQAGRVRWIGRDRLDAALASGRPVLLLPLHTWMVDLPGLLLAGEGHAVVDLVKRQRTSPLDRIWMALRRRQLARAGGRLCRAEDGLRGFIAQLRPGRIGCYSPDVDGGRLWGVQAPLFGTRKSTLWAVRQIVAQSGAIALPVSTRLDPGGNGLRVLVGPPLSDLCQLSPAQVAHRINACVEAAIADAPEHYMWNLPLLRTRPAGEPGLY